MVSLHMFQSVFISLNSILQFSVSCTHFVKFMPRYFILVDGMVSGTVFEFQLPIFYILLIHRKNHMSVCIVGQKVHSGFLVYCYGKPWTFWPTHYIYMCVCVCVCVCVCIQWEQWEQFYLATLLNWLLVLVVFFFGSFIRISCINNHIIFHSVPFMLMWFLQFGYWKHELFAPLWHQGIVLSDVSWWLSPAR